MGGGANSAVWNQIKSDVLNVTYYRLQGKAFGTWGAAMIAGKAVGLINDLADYAFRHAKLSKNHFMPNKDNHFAYQSIIERYVQMEDMLDTFYS